MRKRGALPVESQHEVLKGENSEACSERGHVRPRGRLEQQAARETTRSQVHPLPQGPREEANWKTPQTISLKTNAKAQQVTIKCSGILVGPLAEIFSHRPLLT